MRNPTSDESEQKTRKRLIDPKLRTAGWRVVRFDPRYPFGRTGALATEELPTDNGSADYALCVNGRLLGVETEKLVQTILAKVFRGELVPTKAELVRAERRPYESASALLDRVRASRVPDPSLKRLRSGKAGEHGRPKG